MNDRNTTFLQPMNERNIENLKEKNKFHTNNITINTLSKYNLIIFKDHILLS